MLVTVRDLVGEYPMTLEDGQKVYEKIKPALAGEQVVELDFAGVKVAAAPFLQMAIGQFFKDHSRETLDSLLIVGNLNSVVQAMVRQVVKHAEEYYSSEAHRAAVDKVLAELAEEV